MRWKLPLWAELDGQGGLDLREGRAVVVPEAQATPDHRRVTGMLGCAASPPPQHQSTQNTVRTHTEKRPRPARHRGGWGNPWTHNLGRRAWGREVASGIACALRKLAWRRKHPTDTAAPAHGAWRRMAINLRRDRDDRTAQVGRSDRSEGRVYAHSQTKLAGGGRDGIKEAMSRCG